MKMSSVLIFAAFLTVVLILSGNNGIQNDRNDNTNNLTLTVNTIPVMVAAEKVTLYGEDATWARVPAGLEVTKITVNSPMDSNLIAVIDCPEQPNALGAGIVQGPLYNGFVAISYLKPQGKATVHFLRGDNSKDPVKFSVDIETCKVSKA
jgi:hypothetical protein